MLVAVTGASGFLGRSFVPRALAEGLRVRALAERREAIAEGADRVVGTLADAGARRALLVGADVLLHLAARGVRSRDRAWNDVVAVNVNASLDILLEATERVSSHSVLVSTALEYRGFGRLPDNRWPDLSARCDEDAPLDPPDAYGASKAAAGILLRALCRERRHSAWYLRLASVYGPGDDDAKVLPAALRAACGGLPFPASGGEQLRDWLWIDDAVDGLIRACRRRPPDAPTLCNLGSGEGVALRDVVETLFDAAGARRDRIEWGALPYRTDEPHVLVLEPQRAATLLGFRPATPVHRGVGLLHARTRQELH